MNKKQSAYNEAHKKDVEKKIYEEKRDYFATHALQGLLSNSLLEKSALELYVNKEITPDRYINAIVKMSFEISDAMMKERSKNKDGE